MFQRSFSQQVLERMQELTVNTPKPLLSFNGSALIEHAIGHEEIARPLDFRKRTFSVGKISKLFLWVRCHVFVEENEILDTGGGLKRISLAQNLGTVFTMNSDTLWTGINPLELLMEQWIPKQWMHCCCV